MTRIVLAVIDWFLVFSLTYLLQHDDIDVVDISFAKLRSPEFARIWAHSPTAQQRKDWHRVTLPSRPIPLMRPGADRGVHDMRALVLA